MNNLYVISGVTGMTGNELARRLLHVPGEKNTIIGFDNFFCSSLKTVEDIYNNEQFIFHKWDINSDEHLELLKNEILRVQEQYSSVIYINCAAVVHTEYFYHVNDTFNTNVMGMKRFLEQAIEIGADIYINCSTSEVYSMHSWREEGVREDEYIYLATAEHSQRTSYAAGKLLTEFFMRDAVNEQKINGCSVRFANVYSKNELYPKHIIPYIINELREKGSVELLENSKVNKRTFLHNEDSCAAVIELINSREALDGSVYNVATDEEISIIDLVHLCARKMGIKSPQITFKGYRESDPERRILNTDKIRSKTNWRPVITLDKGIELCIGEKI